MKKLVFLYSGQGPKWPETGKELFAHNTLFHESLRACEVLLQDLGGWRLTEELFYKGKDSRCDDTDVAQPAHFAYQVALTAWLREHGIVPWAVFGHSMGEVAAAYAADVLSLSDAIRVIYHRGRLTHATVGKGRMVWVDSLAEQVQELLLEICLGDQLSITAINEPTTCVVAGANDAVSAVVVSLKKRNIRHNVLRFNYGFHSPLMDLYLSEFVSSVQEIRPQSAGVPIVSTVTGDYLDGPAFDANYWSRNMRDTVRFAETVARLAADGASVFLEIGPHALLAGSTEECLHHGNWEAAVLHTLYRGEPDLERLAATLVELETFGCIAQNPDEAG